MGEIGVVWEIELRGRATSIVVSMGNRTSRKSNKLVEQINCIKERLEELEQELKGKNDWKERFEKEQGNNWKYCKGRLYGDHWIERLA